ncbi:MAG: hypothetical protein IPO83_03875 [Chitinophagaceae bacterium]|nr:hypothetical protein [Chitinophagaceae bacterium]
MNIGNVSEFISNKTQEVDLDSFDSSFKFTDAENPEGPFKITAVELANSSVELPNFLMGDDKTVYKVGHNQLGDITLYKDVDVVIADIDEFQESITTGNLIGLNKEELLSYLKQLLVLAELNCYYTSLGARLHKEAVQDAVDIVQFKKIEFTNAKLNEIDWTGIVLVIVVTVFFELGIIGAIAGTIFGSLSSRMFNSILYKLGKGMIERNKKSALKIVNGNIERLEKSIEILTESKFLKLQEILKRNKGRKELSRGQKGKIQAFSRQIEIENEELINQRKAIDDLISSKELMPDLIKRGKEIWDRKLDNLKPDKRAIIKDPTEVIAGETIKASPPSSSIGQGKIPMEIYLKTYFQNFFESDVLIAERSVLLIKKLIAKIELFEEFPEQLQDIVNDMSICFDFEAANKSFEIFFNESFKYEIEKENITKEFEFLMWSLIHLYGNFTKSTLTGPSQTSKDLDMFKKVTVEFPFSTNEEYYFKERFNMNRIVLFEEMTKVIMKFKAEGEFVNNVLAKEKDMKIYQIIIDSRVKE